MHAFPRRELEATGEMPDTVTRVVGRPTPHESARLHVTGQARYTDDLPLPPGSLHGWPVTSPHAHALIRVVDVSEAITTPGVVTVLTREDVPGENNSGPLRHDEPLFLGAGDVATYHGQAVAWVLGTSVDAARQGASRVVVTYEKLDAILDPADAIRLGSVHTDPQWIRRGDVDAELAGAGEAGHAVVSGEFRMGAQDHFPLETHVSVALTDEDGRMMVHSSTQHPSETQAIVAHALGLSLSEVVVQCVRMGGGFGGKETQANAWAAVAAIGARKTGRAVKVRLDRDRHMILTGKRHPFVARYRVVVGRSGDLRALDLELYADGGWSLDLSDAVLGRAMFHSDNGYFFPAMRVRGQVLKTHKTSQTAFRGFGGPQGVAVAEEIIDCAARAIGMDPHDVRTRNLYRGSGETNTTHYGQEIGDNRLVTIWEGVQESGEFISRREAIKSANARGGGIRRGIAVTPVKFGISFTTTFLNQAGALVLIYSDGSVQVNHGGTEMGQGLQVKMAQVAAEVLGVRLTSIRMMPTRTDKVPNTSATAASSGSDLNGGAVRDACLTLRGRLAPVAVQLLTAPGAPAVHVDDVEFGDGQVWVRSRPDHLVSFASVVRAAYLARVGLSSTGYYRTPGIWFDKASGRGKPFHYYACGAAIAEVEVDGFTGQLRVLRVDILHDVGSSLNPLIDAGQVEGGFIQGMGWVTMEEVVWGSDGRMLTHAPSTYKIPASTDVPADWRVSLLPRAAQPGVIYGSKAVGEPPFMLGLCVREAIRDAVASFAPPGSYPERVALALPATGEAILDAIDAVRG